MSFVELTSARSVEFPFEVTASVILDEADLLAAFKAVQDPDELLFFKLFGPGWVDLKGSERLFVLARVAEIAEGASAAYLNLTASEPESK